MKNDWQSLDLRKTLTATDDYNLYKALFFGALFQQITEMISLQYCSRGGKIFIRIANKIRDNDVTLKSMCELSAERFRLFLTPYFFSIKLLNNSRQLTVAN